MNRLTFRNRITSSEKSKRSVSKGISLYLLLGLAVFAMPLLIGCNSGSNGDDGANYDGIFVVSDDTVGTIVISVNSTTIPTSQTSGFKVTVKNQDGVAVPAISVLCDTEQGLALIEPTSGQELTNSFGEISGIVGCETPGSFQLGCRLPTGVNLRQFVQIFCDGPVPAGFGGFGGSAGGGLGNDGGGGGVDVGDDGEPGGVGTEGIRLTEIAINDTGDTAPFASSSFSVDTTQRNCETDPDETEPDCESFFDTVVSFRVVNNSNQAIQVTGYNYTVPNADGNGTGYTSTTLQPAPIEGSGSVSANGGELTFSALFAEVQGTLSTCGGAKFLAGASSALPTDLGFRNVTVRVFGRNENGDTFTLTGRISLSFDAFDNC